MIRAAQPPRALATVPHRGRAACEACPGPGVDGGAAARPPARARARPAWWQRTLALALAVWFVLLSIHLPALHVCAVHAPAYGGPSSAESQPAAAEPGHAGGHLASGGCASPATRGVGDGPEPAGHLCTCVGSCCGAAVGVVPTPTELAFRAQLVTTPVAPGRAAHDYVAAWTDFVLPFPTAPPSARMA